MSDFQATLQHLGIDKLAHDQTPVTDAYVREVERLVGCELPEAYRTFLLDMGTCTSRFELIYRVKDDWLAGTDIFFGVDPTGTYDLVENWHTYHSRLPASLLAIGTDPGGDLLCIGLADEVRGKLFFWYEEDDMDGPATWGHLYPVADSLGGFFAQLQIEPDEA